MAYHCAPTAPRSRSTARMEHFSGHPLPLIRYQKAHQMGDINRLTDSPKWRVLDKLLSQCGIDPSRVSCTRINGIDGNVFCGNGTTEADGQSLNRTLGCNIRQFCWHG